MKAYEVFFTEDSRIYVEAEDLCYENETKNGIRMVYLTGTDDDGWNTIAMFNLDKITGIREIKKEEHEEQGDNND